MTRLNDSVLREHPCISHYTASEIKSCCAAAAWHWSGLEVDETWQQLAPDEHRCISDPDLKCEQYLHPSQLHVAPTVHTRAAASSQPSTPRKNLFVFLPFHFYSPPSRSRCHFSSLRWGSQIGGWLTDYHEGWGIGPHPHFPTLSLPHPTLRCSHHPLLV